MKEMSVEGASNTYFQSKTTHKVVKKNLSHSVSTPLMNISIEEHEG